MHETLSFSGNLPNVSESAGGPYEKMDGTDCLRGFKPGELWIQARITAIVDIFEALMASDRPRVQEGQKLTECFKIEGRIKIESHADPEIFDGS